mmetsp:Transcript_20399/g.44142  ORF Transcript_20399/g.44142 Transcript_20399/m.44142 type:complete len:143 (-) Transcript_20399:2-430(-)
MPSFAYLPAIIPITIIVYSLVCVLVLYLYSRQLKGTGPMTVSSVLKSYFSVLPPQATYLSLVPLPGGQALLLLTRLLSLLYLFSVALWSYIREDGGNLKYFTLWNMNMLSVYFAAAGVSSMVGLAYHADFMRYESRQIGACA